MRTKHQNTLPIILALCFGVGAYINVGSVSAHAATLDRPFFRAASIVIVFGASDFKENGGTSPVAVDFNLLDNVSSGQAAPDIIGVDGVAVDYNSGFTPISDGSERTNELLRIEGQVSGGVLTNVADFDVLDANDSLTEFGLGGNTDLDLSSYFRISQFFVVSNTAFDIYAHASDLTTTQDFTALSYADLRYFLVLFTTGGGVNGWGSAAQFPGTGGLGVINAINDLGDMSSGPTKVFDGGRRTARTRGNILQQAVSFIPITYISNGDPGNTYDLSMGVGTVGATVTYTVYTP